MKKLSLMVLCFTFSMISLAQAGSLADRAQDIADRLNSAERSLMGRDADDIRYALEQVDYLLQRYDRGDERSGQFTCLSNGSPGSYEKFVITDLGKNKRYGGETSKSTCQDLMRTQEKGLICLSNGSPGSYEKFSVFNFATAKNLGGETSLETCKTLIKNSKRSFMCVSNGSPGSYEKFGLLNRDTNARMGGETSLETCLETIPR
jgi:hypothetical protein